MFFDTFVPVSSPTGHFLLSTYLPSSTAQCFQLLGRNHLFSWTLMCVRLGRSGRACPVSFVLCFVRPAHHALREEFVLSLHPPPVVSCGRCCCLFVYSPAQPSVPPAQDKQSDRQVRQDRNNSRRPSGLWTFLRLLLFAACLCSLSSCCCAILSPETEKGKKEKLIIGYLNHHCFFYSTHVSMSVNICHMQRM